MQAIDGRTYLRGPGRLFASPAIALLLIFSVLPLLATLWFSTLDYRLLAPSENSFVYLDNYARLVMDPAFASTLLNTLALISLVLAISVIGGLMLALLLEKAVAGRSTLRVLVISPFFVMPPVSALLWKNLLMDPVGGFFTWLCALFGFPGFDWFGQAPLVSIAIIVGWQWLPFACLILLTSLQSLDREQREAAQVDGASALTIFRFLTLPHLARPISIIVMMETIFLLGIFAEIFVTTGGGPASSNLAFLVYTQALLKFDIGAASATGIIAVIVANLLALFLVRAVGRSLEA